MNFWAGKPGLTDMTRSRSKSGSTSSTAGEWGGRVHGYAGADAQLLDLPDNAVQVRTGFRVDGQQVGPGAGESWDQTLWLHYHQMNVQGQRRPRPRPLYDHGPNGQVGHKATVHHVYVNVVTARPPCLSDLLPQAGHIGGED